MNITQKGKYIIAVTIALATVLVYLPSLRNGFVGVWDDNINIVENLHIRSLDATFFRWAFLDFHGSNWLPLTWISLAVDYAFWGLNPLGYHLTNIILHVLNTLVVVFLVVKLLQAARERTTKPEFLAFLSDRVILFIGGVTGLLFGIHPVHVESVAWAAERKDVLCALFFLLSIIWYANYVSYKTYKTYMLTLGLFVLALMSKPMAVSLPVVLLILDWYPLNRIPSWKTIWSLVVEKLPFFLMSLVSSMITILAQRSGDSIASLDVVPVSSRLLVAARSLIAYLGKMLLPLNLVPFYPYPRQVVLFSFEYLAVLVLMLGITACALVAAKRHPVLLAAWGYYVVTLIPVLGIVQVGNQSMADRYLYLPSIGPFLVGGIGIAWMAKKVTTAYRRETMRLLVYSLLALCLFFPLSLITIKQMGKWKNSFALWDYTIATGIESAVAYNNRGLSLKEMDQRGNAIADFERAIALDPQNYFAYNNLGVVYGKDGQYPRSIEYFLKAIAINPQHADSYCNLGLSYFNMKQEDKALENYNKAIELKQDFDAAILNRGNLYFIIGNRARALQDYRKACMLGNSRACEVLTIANGE
ncbi:MAG: tetratricopeptide repeat protein [Nitrospirae bacterium]|nr:tetratricopeptide repeat protein [Nitrospirota bacterium]